MAASAHKLLPGLAEPSRADAPSRAAALLPLREGPGGVECLFAQSEILNTVLSTAHRLVFHRWPGELRFIGGPKVLGHADPLETMQQELELLGLPLPRGGADVRLFHKAVFTARDRDFEVIVCIIWVSSEPLQRCSVTAGHVLVLPSPQGSRDTRVCARLTTRSEWFRPSFRTPRGVRRSP